MTGIVVVGDMNTVHMGLGSNIDVPFMVGNNDLGFQIRSVVGTPGRDIAD